MFQEQDTEAEKTARPDESEGKMPDTQHYRGLSRPEPFDGALCYRPEENTGGTKAQEIGDATENSPEPRGQTGHNDIDGHVPVRTFGKNNGYGDDDNASKADDLQCPCHGRPEENPADDVCNDNHHHGHEGESRNDMCNCGQSSFEGRTDRPAHDSSFCPEQEIHICSKGPASILVRGP